LRLRRNILKKKHTNSQEGTAISMGPATRVSAGADGPVEWRLDSKSTSRRARKERGGARTRDRAQPTSLLQKKHPLHEERRQWGRHQIEGDAVELLLHKPKNSTRRKLPGRAVYKELGIGRVCGKKETGGVVWVVFKRKKTERPSIGRILRSLPATHR